MRTYSRNVKIRAVDDEPPTKRRRVSHESVPAQQEENQRSVFNDSQRRRHSRQSPYISSSPKHVPAGELDSSDPPRSKSTPPSSPPPITLNAPSETESVEILEIDTYRMSSAGAGSLRRVLSGATGNARKRRKSVIGKPQQYTQLRLDIGQQMQKQCETCGMEYIVSNPEDAALHQKFHKMNVGGVELGKAFLESEITRARRVWESGDGDCIVECSWKDGHSLKSKTRSVLEVVDLELGSVKIADHVLWSPQRSTTDTKPFKVYLYVKGSKCTGLCLVEGLTLAHQVLSPAEDGHDRTGKQSSEQPLKLSGKMYPALMGVTRIWTSGSHRKGGIATRLLDCARKRFLYGFEVPKSKIAFSQPTEQGAALARKWYGGDSGWHVYSDS